MAIATGGVVPDGADSVVPIEDVEERRRRSRSALRLPRATTSGSGVATCAPATSWSQPASGSAPRTSAHSPPPGVTTRSLRARAARRRSWSPARELRAPGEPLAPGEIYDANGFILAAQLRSTGRGVERLPPVEDDAAATRAAVERGLAADVLVTTGGVSVGVHDLVRAAEAELGVEEIFWRVAVRPGKPIAFGVRGRTLVFGLPGQSGLVARRLRAVRASGAACAARAAEPEAAVSARPAGGAGEAARRRATALLRARTRVEGDAVLLEPLTGQESHMIARPPTADALVLVPQGERRARGRQRRSVPALCSALALAPRAAARSSAARASRTSAARTARAALARGRPGRARSGRRRPRRAEPPRRLRPGRSRPASS